jgi:spore germination cell wall hydrolase CwlJ-like protein
VSNLLKTMNLIVGHIRAAAEAFTGWWGAMSDAERRQTRQRAYSIAACAAVFTMGGPLVGYRFDVQKSEEAWRADSAQFAGQLAADPAIRHSGRVMLAAADASSPRLVNAAFTLKATPAGLAPASATPRSAGPANSDAAAVDRFTSINTHRLDLAEREKLELDCLAKAVFYEARSESTRGQMAVAEVVMNRVNDSRFPKTVCGVVYQGQTREVGCQFTFTCDGSLRIAPAGPAWDRARDVALHVALGLNKPVTDHATHYHTDYVNPYWSPGMVKTAQVGQHIFYRFPKTSAEWARARLALGLQTLDGQPVDADALASRSLAIAAVDAQAGAQPVASSAVPALIPSPNPAAVPPAIQARIDAPRIEAVVAPSVIPTSVALSIEPSAHLVLASAETRAF